MWAVVEEWEWPLLLDVDRELRRGCGVEMIPLSGRLKGVALTLSDD